jgi:hypothetical protein
MIRMRWQNYLTLICCSEIFQFLFTNILQHASSARKAGLWVIKLSYINHCLIINFCKVNIHFCANYLLNAEVECPYNAGIFSYLIG